jgi:hypothetical protein
VVYFVVVVVAGQMLGAEVVVWSFVVLVDPLQNYDCYSHERSSGF